MDHALKALRQRPVLVASAVLATLVAGGLLLQVRNALEGVESALWRGHRTIPAAKQPRTSLIRRRGLSDL
jgi:hypothetical protein